jgi:hypothetical protein
MSRPIGREHVARSSLSWIRTSGFREEKSFNYASGEVTRESQLSIVGGQVAEIKGSRELGSSQGESPRVGCSKSRSHKIARSEDNRWIQVTGGPLDQEPHCLSCIRGFRGWKESLSTSEVVKCREQRLVWTRGRTYKVGPGNRQADTRHLVEGVNTPLTSHVSGIREIRVRELDPSTREVASSENERRKVNIASRGFVKERCQGWTFELAKWRVVRSASA